MEIFIVKITLFINANFLKVIINFAKFSDTPTHNSLKQIFSLFLISLTIIVLKSFFFKLTEHKKVIKIPQTWDPSERIAA